MRRITHVVILKFKSVCFGSRGRLETNAEQWLRLLTTIQDLLSWILKRQTELKQTQKTVGGDLPTVQRQSGDNQVIL